MRRLLILQKYLNNMNTSLNLDIECDVGYYGQNCNFPCRYPNYGKLCQNKCECNKSKCNHIYGCKNILGISF